MSNNYKKICELELFFNKSVGLDVNQTAYSQGLLEEVLLHLDNKNFPAKVNVILNDNESYKGISSVVMDVHNQDELYINNLAMTLVKSVNDLLNKKEEKKENKKQKQMKKAAIDFENKFGAVKPKF